jgi:ketosteroid isomerase-like protein
MKRSIILLLCIVLIISLSCNSKQAGITITQEEFKKIVSKFYNHFDDKDFHSISNMCSDDMFWYTLNGKALKKSGLVGFFRPMMSNWKTVQTTVSDLEYNLSDKLGVARYKTQIDILTTTGGTSMNNLHTMILKHSGKEWQVWQHHMTRKN